MRRSGRCAGCSASCGPPTAARPRRRRSPRCVRIPELVREAADVGLAVDVVVTGDPAALPLGLELAAFRIVQEALTNTRRHASRDPGLRAAGPHRRTASGSRSPTTAAGPAGGPAGHGLVGMRERAALYGGTLDAGPGPAGGFRVSAVLPVGVPAP